MAQPLQGQVKYNKVTDDPEFHQLSPEDQTQVLDHVDSEFRGLNTEDKASVIAGIRDSYNPPKTNFLGDLFAHAGNAAAGYTQDQAIKKSGHGVGAFAGDLIGSLVPIAGGSLAGGAAGSVIPGLGNAAGAFLGGIAGAGAGGAAQDLQAQRLAGAQTPDIGRAATSGLVQGALQAVPVVGKAAPLLKRVGMNALLHGGGAGVGDLAQQAAEQHTFTPQVDIERLKAAAAMGAAGGGVGAYFHKQPKPPVRMLKGYALNAESPIKKVVPSYRGTPEQIANSKFNDLVTQIILKRQAGDIKGAAQLIQDMPDIAKGNVKKAVENFDIKNNARRAINTQRINQAVRDISPMNKRGEPVQQTHTRQQELTDLRNAIQERYKVTPEQKSQAKAKERIETQTKINQNRADAQAKPIEARIKLEQARQDTLKARTDRDSARLEYQRAKTVLDAAKKTGDTPTINRAKKLVSDAQDKITKATETIKANTPKQKAKPNEPKGQTKQQQRPEPAKGQKETKQASKPAAKAEKVAPADNKKVLEASIKKGQSVTYEHRAERAGTREESTFRQKHDLPYELGSNKNGDFVRTINENGQVTMRYLEDIHGAVTPSKEPHPYTYDREGIYKKTGETGRFRVLDEHGNEVEQTHSNLTKDSEVAAKIQKMEEIVNQHKKGTKKPSVREILEASKGMTEADFEKATETMSDEQAAQLCKETF